MQHDYFSTFSTNSIFHKFLIYGAVVAVPVVDAKTPYYVVIYSTPRFNE